MAAVHATQYLRADVLVRRTGEHDPRRDGMGEFRKAAGEHFSHVMEVTGTHSTVRGYHAIYVTGFLKK